MTFQGDQQPPVKNAARRRRVRRIAAVTVPTTAALGAGAMIATGAIPGSDGTVKFCYSGGGAQQGRITYIQDESQPCGDGESTVKISQTGPQGPTGATGATGPAGPTGTGGVTIAIPPAYPIPASDFLLEIEGVKGESKDAKHKETIEIQSWSLGASHPASVTSKGSGAGAGKIKFNEFVVKKAIDKSSPLLFKACATGQHIKKAVLFVRKSGGDKQEYMTVTLEDVLVSSFKDGGQAAGSQAGPIEEVAFSYGKISYDYKPINPDGSLGPSFKVGYDLKANKKL